jgi:hypothetical protein
MLLSWLRSAPKAPDKRRPARRPASFRPALESLSERICPASPHFLKADASITSTGALQVSFKEAGLGDTATIDYKLSADASGQYQWFNHGGNKPQGQPFQFGPILLSATGSFTSGKNGSITATLTAGPPQTPADVLAAGSGKNWTLELTIQYSNITLTDMTNNVTVTATPPSVGPITVVVPT